MAPATIIQIAMLTIKHEMNHTSIIIVAYTIKMMIMIITTIKPKTPMETNDGNYTHPR